VIAALTEVRRLPLRTTDLSTSSQPLIDARVQRALAVIDERYGDETLTVRSCAKALGVSCEHLCRIFRKHTGQTFGAVLTAVRVRQALRLAEDTVLSCKEIAARVGYRSTNQLDKQFQKYLGVSPTMVRRRAIATGDRHVMSTSTPISMDDKLYQSPTIKCD
jgi:transcriptional regulator GlxA family with amidase domain